MLAWLKYSLHRGFEQAENLNAFGTGCPDLLTWLAPENSTTISALEKFQLKTELCASSPLNGMEVERTS